MARIFRKPKDKRAAAIHEETLPKKMELPPRLLYGFGARAGGKGERELAPLYKKGRAAF